MHGLLVGQIHAKLLTHLREGEGEREGGRGRRDKEGKRKMDSIKQKIKKIGEEKDRRERREGREKEKKKKTTGTRYGSHCWQGELQENY